MPEINDNITYSWPQFTRKWSHKKCKPECRFGELWRCCRRWHECTRSNIQDFCTEICIFVHEKIRYPLKNIPRASFGEKISIGSGLTFGETGCVEIEWEKMLVYQCRYKTLTHLIRRNLCVLFNIFSTSLWLLRHDYIIFWLLRHEYIMFCDQATHF